MEQREYITTTLPVLELTSSPEQARSALTCLFQWRHKLKQAAQSIFSTLAEVEATVCHIADFLDRIPPSSEMDSYPL